jgi:hypothetical protein
MATKAQDLDDPAEASTRAMEPGETVSTASKQDDPPPVEDAPGPDEDDLDDLDGGFLFNLGPCYN